MQIRNTNAKEAFVISRFMSAYIDLNKTKSSILQNQLSEELIKRYEKFCKIHKKASLFWCFLVNFEKFV